MRRVHISSQIRINSQAGHSKNPTQQRKGIPEIRKLGRQVKALSIIKHTNEYNWVENIADEEKKEGIKDG